MGDLSKLSDSAKIAFLMEALRDAGHALARLGDIHAAVRYLSYVKEMEGAAHVNEPSP